MFIKKEIEGRLSEFIELCTSHNVKNLHAFGSSTSTNFNKKTSDIDLLVEIDEKDPILRGEKLMSLWDKFEDFFKRKVDLLTYNSIKNPILKRNIDSTKVKIYDGTGGEIHS